MSTVRSKDGTRIAFEKMGQGPAVILVDGAMCSRAFGPMPGLAPLLAKNLTVYMYDRRGRNESGDTKPYALEREVEDIQALIDQAGGSASLYGISSGAALALHAAGTMGGQVNKLAMYEIPLFTSEASLQTWRNYTRKLGEALSAGRRGDAVALFMTQVGVPPEQIAGMRQSPAWPPMEAIAPTLAYDAAALGDGAIPTLLAASITIPTLVMAGGASPAFMGETADALARAIPGAQRRTLPGQTHEVQAEAIAPVLIEFFR